MARSSVFLYKTILSSCRDSISSFLQRRRRHLKSGQAIAKNKDRSCMCTVGGEAQKCRTRGSLRDAPDASREARGGGMKERERLRETRTCRAKTSLRGTPGPVVSSSDQQPAEKWSGLGRTSRTGDAASVLGSFQFGGAFSGRRACVGSGLHFARMRNTAYIPTCRF